MRKAIKQPHLLKYTNPNLATNLNLIHSTEWEFPDEQKRLKMGLRIIWNCKLLHKNRQQKSPEIDQHPLLIRIQEGAIKFCQHL